MKLTAGGYLTFYLPEKQPDLMLDVATPTPLRSLLSELGIPPEEVHLVIVNEKIMSLDEAVVDNLDIVKIFSPIDGG